MIKILSVDGGIHLKQCPDCHCIFSYQEEDLEEETYDDWGFVNYWLACPNCAEKISIGCARRDRKKGSKMYDNY